MNSSGTGLSFVECGVDPAEPAGDVGGTGMVARLRRLVVGDDVVGGGLRRDDGRLEPADALHILRVEVVVVLGTVRAVVERAELGCFALEPGVQLRQQRFGLAEPRGERLVEVLEREDIHSRGVVRHSVWAPVCPFIGSGVSPEKCGDTTLVHVPRPYRSHQRRSVLTDQRSNWSYRPVSANWCGSGCRGTPTGWAPLWTVRPPGRAPRWRPATAEYARRRCPASGRPGSVPAALPVSRPG